MLLTGVARTITMCLLTLFLDLEIVYPFPLQLSKPNAGLLLNNSTSFTHAPNTIAASRLLSAGWDHVSFPILYNQ